MRDTPPHTKSINNFSRRSNEEHCNLAFAQLVRYCYYLFRGEGGTITIYINVFFYDTFLRHLFINNDYCTILLSQFSSIEQLFCLLKIVINEINFRTNTHMRRYRFDLFLFFVLIYFTCIFCVLIVAKLAEFPSV